MCRICIFVQTEKKTQSLAKSSCRQKCMDKTLLYWVFKTNALASVMLTLVNGLTCTGFLTTSSYLDYLNLQEQFLGCLGYPAFKGAKSDFATKLKVLVLVVPFKSCFVT